MGRRGPKPHAHVLIRRKRVLNAYIYDDLTLEQIAKRWGITGERVRQDCNNEDRTLYLCARRRRKARTRLNNFVNERGKNKSVLRLVSCRVCGEEFESYGHQKFCSPTHHKVWIICRYQIDEEFRKEQKIANAKWALDNDPDPSQRRYADRVLTDEAESRNMRWLIRGSLVYHWAIRACILGWPLFDKFHPQIQKQIRDDLKQNEEV